MSVCIETYKQVNLVEFLAEHYGLKFKRSGSGYVAGSPFGADKTPSFLFGSWEAVGFSRIFPAVLAEASLTLWDIWNICPELAISFAALNSWQEANPDLWRLMKYLQKPGVTMTWISFTIVFAGRTLMYAVVI
jgi:DNA primase (bacterial type)